MKNLPAASFVSKWGGFFITLFLRYTLPMIGYIILGVIALAAIIVAVLSRRHTAAPKEADQSAAMQLLLTQLAELQRTVDQKLGDSEKTIRENLQFQQSQTAQTYNSLIDKLARLDEGTKQVIDFSANLRELQDILKNPKQRGVLGEYYLETLLKNVLPPGSYAMQHPFPEGVIVDAAVFVKDKIIPIDSKFSLENYNRFVQETDPARKRDLAKLFESDLKNRIVETSKYIQPENNTMDFAFMFIPHEAIYYDLLVGSVGSGEETENLIQRAASKYRVIIVSPTSFLAYLQTVLQGLKALQIEESAKEIRKRVEELGKHLKSHEEYHNKIGTTLKTVVNHYNTASKELKKVDKDVLRITGTKNDLDPVMLDDISVERTEE
jgi:DNA recombination protein RmuC